MWQISDEMVSNAESKNDLCINSLLNNLAQSRLIENASSNSLNQQSNSSSLESIKSFALDGIQALSTSCSEDSFEMSSPTSKPIAEIPSQQSQKDLDLTSSVLSPENSQDLNLTSNVLSPENPVQRSNVSFNYQNQASSECDSSDHISRENLEMSNFKESSCLKIMNFPIKKNPMSSTSYQQDRLDESNDVREISWNKTAVNGNVIRDGARATESWPMGQNFSSAWKSRNFIEKDKAFLRECIKKELDNLDTCLPQLDFNKLEEKLNCAAKERIVTERKLLGEQVRRRLALEKDRYTADPVPRVCIKPSKSNLGFRLQAVRNLEVCYINDLKDEESEEESSDDDCYMPKSKSAPNLRTSVIDGSNLNASQLRQAISAIKEKRHVLEEETKMMLAKAKQAARMQMEIERLNTSRFTTAIPPKVSRLQLSTMTCRQLMEISEKISKRISEENAELMRLLVEKDSLYMQQDSMLVDIEDMIQHESNSESLNLPDFLKVQAILPATMSKFQFSNG